MTALTPFDGAETWLNGDRVTSGDLAGNVVAVDFWTYSCVNWLRTLPYVNAWAERYADAGLVVVGVHSPEFSFEHDLDNVRRAIGDLGVGYPVVLDNDFAIWRAYGNRYWPALYLLDRNGRVRFNHFGEESYAEIERAMQRLLGVEADLAGVEADGLSRAADWGALETPETYVGYARAERRGDLTPDGLPFNRWALSGTWSVDAEYATLEAGAGAISFHFEGRDLNLVMGPSGDAAPAGFTVSLDGEPPGDDRGLDVGEDGHGVLDGPRMYQLVRQRGPVRPRIAEIGFPGPGARAYVFTFG